MKKGWAIFLLLAGCSTAPSVTPEETPRLTGVTTETALNPDSAKDVMVKELTTDEKIAQMNQEIEQINKEIALLEPQVIASSNRVDPQGIPETKVLKKKLFNLEQKKASLELQIFTLTE